MLFPLEDVALELLERRQGVEGGEVVEVEGLQFANGLGVERAEEGELEFLGVRADLGQRRGKARLVVGREGGSLQVGQDHFGPLDDLLLHAVHAVPGTA